MTTFRQSSEQERFYADVYGYRFSSHSLKQLLWGLDDYEKKNALTPETYVVYDLTGVEHPLVNQPLRAAA